MTIPSGPRSGKHAFINGLTGLTRWSLNWNNQVDTRLHSGSYAAPERAKGVADWNGSMSGFGGFPTGVFPGDTFAGKFFLGPSDGVYGHTGEVYLGTAIVDSLTINWGWQPNSYLNWTANFSGNGCLTEEESEYYDAGTDCLTSMCDILIKYNEACALGTATGTGTVVTLDNVESATLTINASNQAFTNSGSNCCTERVAGTIDWTLDIVDQEQYPIFVRTTFYRFMLYVDATTYWDLQWGLLQNISNINADISTGAIVNKTNNFVMTGRICCGTDPAVIGSITDPGATEKWPAALSA